MCGIVAIYSPSGTVAEAALAAGVAALEHRGPDGQGRWLSKDGTVGLGHARLSIIDVAGGKQPIANETGSMQLVVNGEFYDYRRITDELTAKGHRFCTRTDSEIALHLFEENGPDCLQALRGEFALILWDRERGRLFAARDRFGIKPLYYATRGDTLLLASEIRALLAAGLQARWNHEAVYDMIATREIGDRTAFDGIRQVPPGHYLIATSSSVRLVKYWDWDLPTADATPFYPDEAQAVEAVGERLQDAVRLRLQADVPVGVYLSGGLDSSTVLGIAARHAAVPLDAFTVVFDVGVDDRVRGLEHFNLRTLGIFDEGHAAGLTAAAAGARHHVVRLTPDLLASSFLATVMHCEQPVSDMNSVAKFLLSAAARDRGIKVVLTGEGSDEVFGGYEILWNHSDQLLTDAEYEGFRRDFGALAGSKEELATTFQPLQPMLSKLGFVGRGSKYTALSLSARRRFLAADFANRFATRNPFLTFLETVPADQLAGRSPLQQQMYLWGKQILPNGILARLGDRTEMSHSVEGRLPMLDHLLFEVAKRLPQSLLRRPRGDESSGWTYKYVLRKAAQPFLTADAYQRPKVGFRAPPTAVLQRTGRVQELLHDWIHSSAMASVPFFEQATLAKYAAGSITSESRAEVLFKNELLLLAASMAIMQQHYRM